MGNGWTDPAVQYPAYASYAYEHDLIKKDTDSAKQVEGALAQCLRKIETDGVHISIGDCENILNTILRVTNDQYHPISTQTNVETREKDVSTCTTSVYVTRTPH